MILIVCFQMFIVYSLIATSRRGLENALPLFCFYLTLMPLESRLIIPGVFDLNTMRISLTTLFLLFLIQRKGTARKVIPLKNLMVLHGTWAIFSVSYSISSATSAKQIISQVVEYYLMYYIFVKTISSKQTLHSIVYAMMMAVGVCCIFSVIEVYAKWSILRIFPSDLWITYNGGIDPLYVEWGRGLRVRSTFPHPILFGDALAMSIPLTLYLISIWQDRFQRRVLWVTLALMFWSLYKTTSRGPWIATILCCGLLYCLIHNRVRRYLLVIMGVASSALLARPGVLQTVKGLYQSSTDPSSPVGASYLYRDALLTSIIEAVGKDPGRMLLGFGLGTFREKGLDILFLGSLQHWYTCDNNWAAFLYETGYVGLILIGLLLLAALNIAFKSYRQRSGLDWQLSGVIFISLLGFYILLYSVAGYSWGQQGYMAWILIALAGSAQQGVRMERFAAKTNSASVDEEMMLYAT
ncbi:O-antigen ligase family protein [Granulicella arctica]|uniref:O-antigen ligase family protein n=1 Tax=Granulicella arctica TaxID=940613 RepID=UPI0021E0EC68|nr:O-antigen ligase family protein [Granulicella arctica]